MNVTYLIVNATGNGKRLFLGYGDIWTKNRIDAKPFTSEEAHYKIQEFISKNLPSYTPKNIYRILNV